MTATLSLLHPEVYRRLLGLIEDARKMGVHVRVTSTYRSSQEQKRLYQAWLDRGKTGLPAAPPGFSTHEYGVAVDLVPDDPADLPTVVGVAGCNGFHWAGQSDPVHFDVFGVEAWREWLSDEDVQVPPYPC